MSEDNYFSKIPVGTVILDHKVQRVKNSIESGKNAPVNQRDIQLKEACCELESLFINYLLKEMRETIDKSGFMSGGRAEEIYTSMLDTQMAKELACKGGMGLSSIFMKQLVKDFNKNENVKK